MVFPALAAAALPSVVGGIFGSSSAKKANKAARSNAEEANRLQRDMMTNRHQWEVADLKAAGLNPILSAGGTPSMGSSAQAPVVTTDAEERAKSVSTALAASMQRHTIKNIKQDTANKKQDTEKKLAETFTTDNIGAKTGQEYLNLRKQREIMQYQLEQEKANASSARSISQINRNLARKSNLVDDWYKDNPKTGRFIQWLKDFGASAKAVR
jgi:hypothetical protein